jgi:hypothetical protein
MRASPPLRAGRRRNLSLGARERILGNSTRYAANRQGERKLKQKKTSLRNKKTVAKTCVGGSCESIEEKKDIEESARKGQTRRARLT